MSAYERCLEKLDRISAALSEPDGVRDSIRKDGRQTRLEFCIGGLILAGLIVALLNVVLRT